MSDLYCSSEQSATALERLKALRKSFSLSVPTMIVEVEEQVEDAIRMFPD